MRVDTASLLIVGSYHMANPGRDVFNVQAEDVLADRRQRELREVVDHEVVDHLKRFAPTKVALELATDYERNLKIFANLARSTVPGIAFSWSTARATSRCSRGSPAPPGSTRSRRRSGIFHRGCSRKGARRHEQFCGYLGERVDAGDDQDRARGFGAARRAGRPRAD